MNYTLNWEQRIKLNSKCRSDLDYSLTVKQMCARDIVFFCNNFVLTSDPRLASQGKTVTIPFLLFDKQIECLRWIEDCYKTRQFGLIAKSRDMGISYLCALVHLHKFLFTPDYVGIFASKKAVMVDLNGSISPLFGKVRLMLDLLPGFLKPKVNDSYMKLINLENRASILGESGTEVGRGSRASLVILDEAAFIEQPERINSALSQTADCVIRVSTPNGPADSFAIDYQSGLLPTFSLHWLDDDRKNKWVAQDGATGQGRDAPIGSVYPWYEDQKSKHSPETIARELDIDFTRSQSGTLIESKWVQAAVDFPIMSSSFSNQAGFDVASSGKCLNTLIVVQGGNRVSNIESWSEENTTISTMKALDLCRQYQVDKLNYDVCGIGAGVSSTLALQPKLNLEHEGINGGSSPSEFYWTAENISSKEKYANRRAELWDAAKIRFKKTYEMRNGIAHHPLDECISIPNHQKLIQELSTPVTKYRSDGKLLLESKQDMAKRNVSSPDFADALIYSLARSNSLNFVQSKAYY